VTSVLEYVSATVIASWSVGHALVVLSTHVVPESDAFTYSVTVDVADALVAVTAANEPTRTVATNNLAHVAARKFRRDDILLPCEVVP